MRAQRRRAAAVTRLGVRAVEGLPRLTAGDDLAALLADSLGQTLADGDVVCVSSKAVAKVEGRTVRAARDRLVEAETDRVVARQGTLRVVRTRHGLVLAAAGVDASNTEPGSVVPLPHDPDGSARALRAGLRERTARNVAVLVTDTAGRAWRTGQTDLAVGCAGLPPLVDLAGRTDAWGNVLEVTEPAVADAVAAAADLVLGKAALTPAAVVSGLGDLVLPPGADGPGAAALVRPEAEDLFGLGAADAVRAAARRGADDARGFSRAPGSPADRAAAVVAEAAAPLAGRLDVTYVHPDVTAHGDPVARGALGERLAALGWASGLLVRPVDDDERPDDPAAPSQWTLRDRP